jgi:hypothetical protein
MFRQHPGCYKVEFSCFEIDQEMDAILLIIGIVLRGLPNRH